MIYGVIETSVICLLTPNVAGAVEPHPDAMAASTT